MSPAVTTPGPCLARVEGGLVAVVHADGHVLEVEQDFDHVLLQAFNRGVLVQHAVDLDLGDGEAGDRGQQHATQRVAEGVAIAAFQRLDHDLGAVVGDTLDLPMPRGRSTCVAETDIRRFSGITSKTTRRDGCEYDWQWITSSTTRRSALR
jgi:hypothetical protein